MLPRREAEGLEGPERAEGSALMANPYPPLLENSPKLQRWAPRFANFRC